VTAILVAFACSGFASFWALRQLRLVGTALHLQPSVLSRALARDRRPDKADRFDRALRADRDAWEALLISQIVGATSPEQAQAEANAALLDIDGRLMPATKVYAACARIAVFGCLIGAAILFMAGNGLSMAVVDVFAIGAAGVLVSLAAGKEAQRLVKRKREEVDVWVESLVGLRWQHQG